MSKEREILMRKVTRKDGRKFNNPLKLNEVHLISTMCKESKEVLVKRIKVSKAEFKYHFG